VTQTVELLLDPASEAWVHDQWTALRTAGLPSLADHTGASNRPHVTVCVVPAVDVRLEGRLAPRRPFRVTLGPPGTFGHDPVVLVRPVLAGDDLRTYQADVAALLGASADDLTSPARWSPHVTLARRLARSRVADALAVVEASTGLGARRAELGPARRWDSAQHRAWLLDPGL
jgi:hypothetical protein